MSVAVSLAGRAALVTGSVGGLGHAFAARLAAAGATVVLSGLEEDRVAEPIRAALAADRGVPVHYVRADLREIGDVRRLVQEAERLCGSVDVLVNNAVVRHFAPIEEFPLDRWHEALAVNLTAALVATQSVLPRMRARDYGRIFNMTSVYGSRATIDRVDYVTTKTAIQGLTRSIAMETSGSGISCHALTPGSTLTPIWEAKIQDMMANDGLNREEAERRFLAGKQPSGRFVSVESVTDMMMLLCGPIGADMNGAILPIEGGWLARG